MACRAAKPKRRDGSDSGPLEWDLPCYPSREARLQCIIKDRVSLRMKCLPAAGMAVLAGLLPSTLFCLTLQAPKAGKVEIMKASDVKPGMQATAWTVFEGSKPEPVPIEIVGTWKNMW